MLRELSIKTNRIPPQSWIGIPDLDLSLGLLTRRLGIPLPIDKIEDAEASLTDSLRKIWKGNLVILPIHRIKDCLLTVVGQIEKTYPDSLTVSLDPFYTNDGPFYHVNRIVNQSGSFIGFGPRPGEKSLDFQIKTISELAHQQGKSKILIVDDFLMSGRTTLSAIKAFQKKGFDIVGVAVGVARESTVEEFFNLGIEVVAPFIYSNIIDSAYYRDLVAGSPRAGLVLGKADMSGQIYPSMDKSGIPFRPPYAAAPPKMPWDVTAKWAGIPESEIRDFSVLCWTVGQTIHTALVSSDGNKTVELGELVADASSTVGFPGPPPSNLEDGKLDPKVPILEVINDKLKKILGFPDRKPFYSIPNK